MKKFGSLALPSETLQLIFQERACTTARPAEGWTRGSRNSTQSQASLYSKKHSCKAGGKVGSLQ